MMEKIGIYCIYFEEIDNKYYIGYSSGLNNRKLNHLNALKRGNHHNYLLQKAYEKYGDPIFYILEECTLEELSSKEREYITLFDSYHNGFNLTNGGEGNGFGEGNNAAKHTEQEYYNVLQELIKEPIKPYSEISKLTNISLGIIKSIATLKSHNYLKEKYPEEYAQLELKRLTRDNSAKSKGIVYPILLDPNNKEYRVDNIHTFAKEHGLQYQNLHKVLIGKRRTHLGWKIK